MEEETFYKKKIGVDMNLTRDLLNDISIVKFEDVVLNKLTFRLESSLYERTVSEKTIIHFLDKPTFMDWVRGFLFNKRKTQFVKINVSEALKHPPVVDDSKITFYNAEKTENP